MSTNRMSSRQRMLAAMTRQEADHIPFSPYIVQGPLRPSMNKDGLSTTISQHNIGSLFTLSGSAFYSGSKPENGLGNTVCILRE
jgi:hypothetical protein